MYKNASKEAVIPELLEPESDAWKNNSVYIFLLENAIRLHHKTVNTSVFDNALHAD